ncbi:MULTISPECIES: hypothetical protein [unclassified Stygiolobus]|uniref:hypothetical protein n=1 Tax=unclassified Stygiolobus TaxID=2824672 RepID=UPI00307CDE1B
MGVYSHDVTIQTSKDRVVSLLTDPFLLTGVFGHINILQVYDQKERKYVTPSSLSGFSNKFLVIYIFGTPDTKMNFFEGEMEGPVYSSEGVIYRGWTKDQKFTWEMKLQTKAIKPMETLVRIIMTADYKVSGLDKILGRSPFALAQHMVEDHILPYIKYYLKTQNDIGIEGITPTKLLEEQGTFSQILPKITKASVDVEYGIVVIKGEDVNGRILIKNGKIVKINVNYKGRIIQGQDAILELVSLLDTVRATLYAVYIDEVLMTKLEKYALSNTSQEISPE